jgi:hypothetical protein
VNRHGLFADREQIQLTQLAKDPVDVDRCQTECVGEHELAQRAFELRFRRKSDQAQSFASSMKKCAVRSIALRRPMLTRCSTTCPLSPSCVSCLPRLILMGLVCMLARHFSSSADSRINVVSFFARTLSNCALAIDRGLSSIKRYSGRVPEAHCHAPYYDPLTVRCQIVPTPQLQPGCRGTPHPLLSTHNSKNQ